MNGSELNNMSPAFYVIGVFMIIVSILLISIGWRIKNTGQGKQMLFNSFALTIGSILLFLDKFVPHYIAAITTLSLLVIGVVFLTQPKNKNENKIYDLDTNEQIENITSIIRHDPIVHSSGKTASYIVSDMQHLLEEKNIHW